MHSMDLNILDRSAGNILLTALTCDRSLFVVHFRDDPASR